MSLVSLLRESWAAARAGRMFSLLYAAVAVVVVAVMVTLMGQAAAQRGAVEEMFESPGYRTVTLTSTGDAPELTWDMAQAMDSFTAVESAWVSSAAFDVHNPALAGEGQRAAAREIAADWDELPIALVSGRLPTAGGEAVLEVTVAERLGIDATGGVVERGSGRQWAVVGFFESAHERAPTSVLVPADVDSSQPHAATFTVASVARIDEVTSLVASAVGSGAGSLAVDRSDEVAMLQEVVTGSVSEYGVVIVATAMGSSLLTVLFLSLLTVHSRRQEFGRRRALGMTRADLVVLIAGQGLVVTLPAALLGAGIGTLIAAVAYQAVPSWVVLGTVVTLQCCVALVAQLPSAVSAGLRDPVRVIRSP